MSRRKIVPGFILSFLIIIILVFSPVISADPFHQELFVRQMREEMEQKTSDIDLNYTSFPDNMELDDIQDLLELARQETNPYIKYNVSSWSLNMASGTGEVEISIEFDYHTTTAEDEFVFSTVEELADRLWDSGMTEDEIIKQITDFVAVNIEYDHSYRIYDVYGALNDRRATCQGYAILTHLLLEEAEIENIFVEGDLKNRTEPHLWNMINLAGEWYHLDLTQISYHYQNHDQLYYGEYLISDQALAETHEWEQGDYPQANNDYREYLLSESALNSTRISELEKELNLIFLKEEYTALDEGTLRDRVEQSLIQEENRLQVRIDEQPLEEINELLRDILNNQPELGEELASWQASFFPLYLRDENSTTGILTLDYNYH